MTYDSTLSYADRAGFRCGTCREYSAFDPVKACSLALRIRPLVAMECSILSEKYMGQGMTEVARESFMRLKEACRTVNGSFTLLWHNSELRSAREREFYQAVLSA